MRNRNDKPTRRITPTSAIHLGATLTVSQDTMVSQARTGADAHAMALSAILPMWPNRNTGSVQLALAPKAEKLAA